MKIHVETPTPHTPRCTQLRGLFDITETPTSFEEWESDFDTRISERNWNLGLIAGPSGCGKSTIASACWPNAHRPGIANDRLPIIETFPENLPLRTITEVLSSVGFSSPPAWLRPLHVLSTGQRWRAEMAHAICTMVPGAILLCDEYTSVVDRTVAQIGSAAIARTMRKTKEKMIAVTCHMDVEEWLQPDWIYLPAANHFAWRSLRRCPQIDLEIVRCHSSAWRLFAPHHYLSASLNPSSQCWLALYRAQPVAFSAWLSFFGPGPKTKREHRTVCLPDYQGIGIGNRLSATIASMWTGLGYGAISTTTHPGMIASRQRGTDWRLTRAPSLGAGTDKIAHATTRLTAGFRYVGPSMKRYIAETLRK